MEEEININNYPNLFNIFAQYQEEFVRVLKERLEQAGRKASGNLINSLQTNLRIEGTEVIVYLISADYLQQTTQGRPPTKSGGDGTVQRKIYEWIENKHILPRPMQDKNGKQYLPTQQQLAYLIARKIHREGFKGDDILTNVIEELNNKYMPLLTEALTKDFDNYCENILLKEICDMIKF